MARPSTAAAELLCLVVAASVPAVPARSALGALLNEASAAGRGVGPSAALAALAAGLGQGTVAEWQHAVEQLLPPLASHGLLAQLAHQPPPPAAEPAPAASALALPEAGADRTLVQSAHCLLRAAHVCSVAHARRPDAPSAPDGAQQRRRQQLQCFAVGLAKWLAAASRAAQEPATAACLLGACLNASTLSPAAGQDRYGVVQLQLQQRLLELLPPRNSAPTDGEAEGEDKAVLAEVERALARCWRVQDICSD